jgi:septum formation protein
MFALPKVYLASKSPRRRELLKQIGVSYEVLLLREGGPRGADVDETPLPDEQPKAYVERISRLKAQAAWNMVESRRLYRQPVLAADTTVALGDRILAKPIDRDEAKAMLLALSDREHQVFTCVTIRRDNNVQSAVSESTVRFAPLSIAEIDAYVRTGEPMDKAGAYAIQGFAQAFVQWMLGSYSGVMGLPLHETVTLLRKYA